MSDALAQILLKGNYATAEALDDALQRQVVFGGSLDTNLLEAGAAKEAELLEALALAHKVPSAGKPQIDAIGAHIPKLFPLVFAETYRLVPYRLVEQEFWVLLNGPPDAALFDRIHERLNLKLVPNVTTEVRLHYAMNRLYGTALLPRFQNLLHKLDGGVPQTGDGKGEHVLSWGLSSAPISPTRARGDKSKQGFDLRGLLTRLDAATDRDSIVEILLGAALASFEFAGLFLVQGDTINGWRSTTPEATQKLVRVSVKIELPSVFQTIYATHGHYLGQLNQNSINTRLLADMGRQAPRAAFLAPIQVAGKMAAILYADNGPRTVPPKRVAAVLLLAQRAGLALEGLIRRNKTSAQRLREPQKKGPLARDAEPPKPGAESWVVDEVHVELMPEEPAAPAAALPEQTQLAAGSADTDVWNARPLEAVTAPEAPAPLSPEPTLPDAVAPLEADGPEEVHSGEYEIFPDVRVDDAKEALDDWEDVLVEASGIDSKAAEKKKTAPPSVTWEDVIAEAERAQHLLVPKGESIEVAGTVVDERELLFDSIDAQDPEARRGAVERLLSMGAAIDEELRQRFPGRLDWNPLAPDVRLPPFRRCNGLCELLVARGPSAAPVVLHHLESDDPVRRLFAIYFLHAVPYPPAIGALARRLYDTEPRNRYLAADALRTYAREPGYAHIVQGLRDQLKVPILESQIATVQVLGQLRDPSSVPSLIPLVVSPRQELAGAAASSLAVICAQAFGADVTRWAEWWRTHFNQPRAAWLIEGLRHANPALAKIAHGELVLISGMSVAFDPEGTPAQRDAAIRAWESWWQQAARNPVPAQAQA